MASAEAALDLWRLAVWTLPQERLRVTIQAPQSYASLAPALSATPEGRNFLQRWETFMATHGHRAQGEIDLAAPRWSETPDEILRQLRHYLDHAGQMDLQQLLDQRTQERERAWTETRARLKNPARRWIITWLIRQAQAGIVYRENYKNELLRVVAYLRRLLLELGDRFVQAGKMDIREDIFFLALDELESVHHGRVKFNPRSLIKNRREQYRQNQDLNPPPLIVGDYDPVRETPPLADPNARVLHGLAVSPGVVTGPARVILDPHTPEKVRPGEILIAPYTDPGWTPLFLTAAGLVTDLGGQLSHGSVIAREYGLPAVVNVPYATRIIQTGQQVTVDGHQGIVRRVSP
jgi:pyruvate,water dikinase